MFVCVFCMDIWRVYALCKYVCIWCVKTHPWQNIACMSFRVHVHCTAQCALYHSCWSGRLLVVTAGGGSRRTTECWRYSQHNEDSPTPISETSTNTSCRRPCGKQDEILRRLFCSSAGSSAAFPGNCFGCPEWSWRWSLGSCNFFVCKIPDFVIVYL